MSKSTLAHIVSTPTDLVIRTLESAVIGARSMPGNPYDGHTLAEALEQAAILSDVQPEIAVVDRG